MVMMDRRPKHERDAIRALMIELGVKYTAALREYERRNAATNIKSQEIHPL
jgi:hypothetical protein